jgi:Asp-tRNA(Asn)/Glu-tRNA(Gln) amidotransferase A subunit family amidase
MGTVDTSRLHAATATTLRNWLESGLVTAAAVREACLGRIHALEPTVQAWEHLVDEPMPGPAQSGLASAGALAGVPVGVKDIIAVRGMPIGWGTTYLRRDDAGEDAAVVALLRRAGAVLMGKTVTTEFAYFTPGKTRNPWAPDHTPGGSSSGSAAAVAAGMVPIAFGTQTAGSIIRPASYCGVIGFKPTFGMVSVAGVKAFSPGLDTVGCFARSVDDVALAHAALCGLPALPLDEVSPRDLRVRVVRVPADGPLSAEAASVLEYAARTLAAAGAQVADLDDEPGLQDLPARQSCIMAFEAARTLAADYDRHATQMSLKLREIIEQGAMIPPAEYVAACQAVIAERARLARRFSQIDLLLAPGGMGEAPQGLGATGDPLYIRAWTALGLPALSLPVGQGATGLPIGVQCIGAAYGEARLLAAARSVMHLLRPDGVALAMA